MIARHHSCASPSVCGKRWQSRQQRRRTDEQDDDRRAQEVEDDEDDGGDRAAEAEQGQEDAATGERADDERLQRAGARGGAGAVAEERTRRARSRPSIIWPLRLRLALMTMPAKHEPPDQVLERVAGSAASRGSSRAPAPTEHEQDKQRVGGDQADLPQLRDLRVAARSAASRARSCRPARASG